MRTCTGVAVDSSTPAHRGGAANVPVCRSAVGSSTLADRGGAASVPVRSFVVRSKRKALGGAEEVHTVDMNEADQLATLEGAVLALEPAMAAYQRRYNSYKFQIAVNVAFHKAVDPTVVTRPPVTLWSRMAAVYPNEVPQLVETVRHLLELIEHFELNGSGWVFSNFVSLELTLWHLDPLHASAFVPLPKWIRDNRALTNIIGTGIDCFKWAVLAGLHPASCDRPNRMENYLPFVEMYDFSSLTFPVPLSSLAPFAARSGISINVYAVEDGKRVVFPLCVTSDVVTGKHVELLLHEMGGIQHYSTIVNFSRLISGQINSHDGAVYCCKKCLHVYSSPELLETHSLRCSHVQLSKFPKDSRCRFTNVQKQLPAPFVVYADFESVLKPIGDVDITQGVTQDVDSEVLPYQEHIAYSFSYKIVSSIIPDFNKPIVWNWGEDGADEFIRELQREAEELCAEFIDSAGDGIHC